MARRKKVAKRAPKRKGPRGLKVLALTTVFAIGFTLGHWPQQVARAVGKGVKVAKRVVDVATAPTLVTPPAGDAGADAKGTYIVGEITADSLDISLKTIQVAEKGSTVDVYISSPGGDAFAMMAWVDAVEVAKARSHIKLSCTTGSLVASAAAIIFETCDVRIASARTAFLFHGVAGMAAGKAGDIEDRLKALRAIEHLTAVLVAPHLGLTTAQYEAWIDRHDRWLTSDELEKMGGLDKIV